MAGSTRLRNALTLFSAADCATSHRVRLVLAAKGVSHELILVDPASPPEDLLELNPTQSLPTLADRDLVLYAASVISEYIDERYPHPPLMPIDPLSRARLRLAMLRLEQEWVPEVEAIQTGTRGQADAARLRLTELIMASLPLFRASRFFLNGELSLADCALAPILWRLPSLGVRLGREARPIEDYGLRIFRSAAFTRSLTEVERELHEVPE